MSFMPEISSFDAGNSSSKPIFSCDLHRYISGFHIQRWNYLSDTIDNPVVFCYDINRKTKGVIKMKKDRFVAFFDAIMAIIMTITVLQFAVPNGASWSDLKELSFQIMVYALSFFWLGMMWINIHNLWNYVEVVSRSVILVNMFMLFFSSMIPFFIIYIGKFFYDALPQLLYGVDVICITVFNQLSLELLKKQNPQLITAVKTFRRSIALDLIIKVAGIIVGMVIYPPAVLISVFIALVILVINFILLKKANSNES